MKVLITAATTAGAHKLKGALAGNEIVLGDQVEMPAFMGIIKLPNPSSDTFAHEMLTLCLDHGIDTAYLLNPKEVEALELSKQLFSEYNITLTNGQTNL